MSVYVVTGGAGFIGSSIVETLLDQGETVRVLDDFSHGKEENLAFTKDHENKKFLLVKGDVRDLGACKKVSQGADYILHHAALGSVPNSIKEPELYHAVNIGGLLNMLRVAKETAVKRFVFASSSSVYGDTKVMPKVETMLPNPKSPYALSKITGEYYCRLFNDLYQLPTIAFRYFNVFGPKQDPNSQYSAVVPKFLDSFLLNKEPIIHGDGTQTRDFTYIKNVVSINLRACKVGQEACGKVYNIGCGVGISINQLSYAIGNLLGSSLMAIYGPSRLGDVQDSLADIKLAEQHLGMKDLVSFEAGLSKTISWFKKNFKSSLPT